MDSLDDFLNALQAPEDTSAPFNLSEKQNNKVIFEKVRAKNFRSIGNEFLEFDFLASKTTLVISEDNGAGKSNLCVWAPYFALTGRPYGKGEKIGAIVNSQTRKDLVVEFFIRTKGWRYKVIRGYKPAIFDIYREEGGAWVKFDAPSSSAIQQSNLERLVGFDSKVLEKVVVLGLDKFQPFVDLDAQNRRMLVEKIWDLSVFSVMLDEAKKRASIIKLEKEQISIEIDRLTDKVVSENEKIVQAKSFESEIETLQNELKELEQTRLPELEAFIQKTESEHQTLIEETKVLIESKQQEKKTASQAIIDQFKEKGKVLKEKLDKATELGETLRLTAKAKFDDSKIEIESRIEKANTEHSTLNNELMKTIKSKIEELETNLQFVSTESKVLAEREISSRSGQEPYLESESKLKILKGDVAHLNLEYQTICDSLSELKIYHSEVESRIRSIDSDIQSTNNEISKVDDKLEEFKIAKEKLAETGNCPHCLQLIGDEALKLYEDSVKSKVQELIRSKTELSTELGELQTSKANEEAELEKVKVGVAEQTGSRLIAKENLDNTQAQVNELETQIKIDKNNWVNELDKKRQSIIDNHTQKAKDELSEYKASSHKMLQDERAEQANVISGLEYELKTLQARINEAVSKAETEAQIVSSEAKINYETWQNNARSALTEATAEITQTITNCEDILNNGEVKHKTYINKLEHDKYSVLQDIESKKSNISSLENKVKTATENSGKIVEETKASLEEKSKKHQDLTDENKLNSYMIDELGDSAAKREIIKKYIPFLNNKINEYMGAMNLFVGFRMDEKFDISFDSPDRKTQTIYSLSNGQKTRMNLAVLFALRDIANLKNTTDCNLLVLDELLEPISSQGIREVTEMLRIKFSQSNVVVITQRANEFAEHFSDVVCYALRGGLTTIVKE